MAGIVGLTELQHTNGTSAATINAGGVISQPNKPMFKATGPENTSLANNTWAKAQFNSEVFDVGGYYDHTTNYRYTPLVAGKYLIYGRAFISYGSDGLNAVRIAIYKNGSQDATFNRYSSGSSPLYGSVQVQALLDFNGSSDYVEFSVRAFTSGDAFYNLNYIHGEFSGYLIG